jgi:hypothetical protein
VECPPWRPTVPPGTGRCQGRRSRRTNRHRAAHQRIPPRCLHDVATDTAVAALPSVVAVAVAVGLHLWRRNALVGIPAGTVVHVALASGWWTG